MNTAYRIAAPIQLGPATHVIHGVPVIRQAEPVHDLGVGLHALEEWLGVKRWLRLAAVTGVHNRDPGGGDFHPRSY